MEGNAGYLEGLERGNNTAREGRATQGSPSGAGCLGSDLRGKTGCMSAVELSSEALLRN